MNKNETLSIFIQKRVISNCQDSASSDCSRKMVPCQKGDDLRRQIAISVLLLAMNSVITLRLERDDLSGNAPTNLPALHRPRSNCQAGTGTDSPWRLVDGEAGWWVGIKRGVSPPLEYFTIFKVDSQQSAQAESSNHSGKGPQLESDRRNLNQI